MIAGSAGSGTVVALSTLAGTVELADPNYSTLFNNAVNFSEGAGSIAPVPVPPTLLAGAMLMAMAGLIMRVRRTA